MLHAGFIRICEDDLPFGFAVGLRAALRCDLHAQRSLCGCAAADRSEKRRTFRQQTVTDQLCTDILRRGHTEIERLNMQLQPVGYDRFCRQNDLRERHFHRLPDLNASIARTGTRHALAVCKIKLQRQGIASVGRIRCSLTDKYRFKFRIGGDLFKIQRIGALQRKRRGCGSGQRQVFKRFRA